MKIFFAIFCFYKSVINNDIFFNILIEKKICYSHTFNLNEFHMNDPDREYNIS